MTVQISSVSNTVVVVDEIGKMELFSQSFVNLVRELFASPQATILATVPITKQRPIPFVDELKCREDVTLIEVSNAENRFLNSLSAHFQKGVICLRHAWSSRK